MALCRKRLAFALFAGAVFLLRAMTVAWAGQGITGIRATYETNVRTNDDYATLGPGGGGFDPATTFNIKFNITTQNNLRCDGFEVGTNEFSYILLADGINIARVDNPTPCTGSLHVVLYEDNGYAAGTNIDLKASYAATMENSLLSVYVNRGSDNTGSKLLLMPHSLASQASDSSGSMQPAISSTTRRRRSSWRAASTSR